MGTTFDKISLAQEPFRYFSRVNYLIPEEGWIFFEQTGEMIVHVRIKETNKVWL